MVVRHKSRHVDFESWCERDNLMLLDFDPNVAGFSSQPFPYRNARLAPPPFTCAGLRYGSRFLRRPTGNWDPGPVSLRA